VGKGLAQMRCVTTELSFKVSRWLGLKKKPSEKFTEAFEVSVCFVFSPGAVQEGGRGLLWAEGPDS